MGHLINLPKAKWSAAGKQPGLKPDMLDIEGSILESFGLAAMPGLVWVDNTACKVPATADNPARVMLSGFPDILHPGQFFTGDLSDGRYRENAVDATMDFDLAACLWGTEKANQWYAVLALAGAADAVFTLKSMPYCRFLSQASQVISLGSNTAPATGIGYGFTTDELAGGKIYVLSGASRGLLRDIVHNNNDNGTGGTIEYSGDALTLAQGDWFIVLPPGTNFLRVGDIFNDPSSNLLLEDIIFGQRILMLANRPWVTPFTRTSGLLSMIGGGAGYNWSPADTGGPGDHKFRQPVDLTPGTIHQATIGAGGGGQQNGGTTSLGSLLSVSGGTINSGGVYTSELIASLFWGYGRGGTTGAGTQGSILVEFS